MKTAVSLLALLTALTVMPAPAASQWADTGVGICEQPNIQGDVVMIPDGFGGAFIAWEDLRNSADYDIYAQKLDGSGSKLWTADVCVNSASVTAGEWSPPAIGVDASGNAVVTWTDGRSGSDGIYA